jgi:hypothetical protein
VVRVSRGFDRVAWNQFLPGRNPTETVNFGPGREKGKHMPQQVKQIEKWVNLFVGKPLAWILFWAWCLVRFAVVRFGRFAGWLGRGRG